MNKSDRVEFMSVKVNLQVERKKKDRRTITDYQNRDEKMSREKNKLVYSK